MMWWVIQIGIFVITGYFNTHFVVKSTWILALRARTQRTHQRNGERIFWVHRACPCVRTSRSEIVSLCTEKWIVFRVLGIAFMTNDEIFLTTIFHITLLKSDFRCGHVERQTFGYRTIFTRRTCWTKCDRFSCILYNSFHVLWAETQHRSRWEYLCSSFRNVRVVYGLDRWLHVLCPFPTAF